MHRWAVIVLLGPSWFGCGGSRLSSRPGGTTDGGGGATLDGGDDALCSDPGAPGTFPWTFQTASADAGGDGAQPDGGASGCQTEAVGLASPDVACSGAARLLGSSGGAIVEWGDGSELVWVQSEAPAFPWAPSSEFQPPQSVWASFERHTDLLSGGFGGTTTALTMEIRDAEGGPIRFMARQGKLLPEPSADQLTALFGIDAASVPTCGYATVNGCTPVLRTPNAHVLLTTPPQTIAPAMPVQVQAPNGRFEVIWYSSSDQIAGPATCVDGDGGGPPSGFIANRFAGP